MHPALLVSLFAAAAAVVVPAQERDHDPIYRDFSLVHRLRVVCSEQHFGRVVDLVAEVPSGRLTGAVVAMALDKDARPVFVPCGEFAYEARSNLLRLDSCQQKEEKFAPFDPATVKLSTGAAEDGGEKTVTGTVLVSRLQNSGISLQGGAAGSAQGVTLELSGGHVAFVDVAVGTQRAGDAELHPVPWSALRVAADPSPGVQKVPVLALAKTAEGLAGAPNLIQVIVQNPLYRGRIYAYFEVPPPAFDRQ